MSKSATSEYNYVGLTDKPEQAAKKIMRAVTDSGKEIIYDEKKKPAISNLLTIYSLLSDKSIKELEKKYQGRGYSEFKKDLADIVKEFLTSFQNKFSNISDREVKIILENGAQRIKPTAEETLQKVKERLGVN
jgi:tryptophanyl-tRNA synthetase